MMAQLSSKTLHRLLYRSRPTVAAVAELEGVVSQIVRALVERNRAVGLTGLLVVVKGHFIQALEGDIDVVRATYARISLDRRHQDLRIISQAPAQRRLFGEWNMCAATLTPSDKAVLDVVGGKDFNPQALTAVPTERLLTAIAAVQRRLASAATAPTHILMKD